MTTPIVVEFKKRTSSIAAYFSADSGISLSVSASKHSIHKSCPSLRSAKWHGHRYSVDVEELAQICESECLEISKVLNPDCDLLYYCVVPSYSATTGFGPLCDVAYSFTRLPTKEDIMAAENLEGSIVVVSTKLSKRGRVMHYPVFEVPHWIDPFDSWGEEDLDFLANVDQEDAVLLYVARAIAKARKAFLDDEQSVERINDLAKKCLTLPLSGDLMDGLNFDALIRAVSAMDNMYVKLTEGEVNALLAYAQESSTTNSELAKRLFNTIVQAMQRESSLYLVERLSRKQEA